MKAILQPHDLDERLIAELTNDETVKIIKDFKDWIEDKDDKENHTRQKQSIFSLQLYEYLNEDENNRFKTLFMKLRLIAENTRKSYELYLEEFNYSRFAKKLEEKTVEYYEKISKSILDIRNQVLSLPISFVVVSLIKDEESSLYVLVGLLLYCTILFVMLLQQDTYLGDIKKETEKFTGQSVDFPDMQKELKETQTTISKRIQTQKNTILFFKVLVVCIGLLTIWQQFSCIKDFVKLAWTFMKACQACITT